MTANSPNPLEFSEADTYDDYVTPAIQAAGWSDSPFEIAEQRSFTDGCISALVWALNQISVQIFNTKNI